MKCPYCLSLVEDEAVVCKVCTRDFYLFKPLMEKVHQLEDRLDAVKDHPTLSVRIKELEGLLEAERFREELIPETAWYAVLSALRFVFIPLALLLLAHSLITVVYDANLLYLRIVSVVLPWPFGYYLFKSRRRSLFPWFIASGVLAALSVVGMSAITSLVDHTPVVPQSMLEWRELLEYAASITFSFLTGMLIGNMAHNRAYRTRNQGQDTLMRGLVEGVSGGKLSPATLQMIMKKVNEFGSSIVALGATGASLYTGLKAVI